MYDAPVVEEFDPQHGYTLKIMLDPEPLDPFEDDEGKIVTFVFEHRRYNLGDMDRNEFARYRPDLVDDSDPERSPQIPSNQPDILAFHYVEMLDHSGLRFYLQSDRINGTIHVPYSGWDSGVIGVALITRQEFERVGLDPDADDARERASREVRSAVDILDRYHSGQVYGYEIEDPDGDTIESGWDFYEESEAISEGKASLEGIVEEQRKVRAQLKQEAFDLGA
jgi:hypothetical protein